MKETLGSQGVQVLLRKLKDQQKKLMKQRKKGSRQRMEEH